MIYYKDNILMCEDIEIRNITDVYKTPFYIYSKTIFYKRLGF